MKSTNFRNIRLLFLLAIGLQIFLSVALSGYFPVFIKMGWVYREWQRIGYACFFVWFLLIPELWMQFELRIPGKNIVRCSVDEIVVRCISLLISNLAFSFAFAWIDELSGGWYPSILEGFFYFYLCLSMIIIPIFLQKIFLARFHGVSDFPVFRETFWCSLAVFLIFSVYLILLWSFYPVLSM